ncbi:galectin-3-like [Uranotaenia lowii]|uniref:galectin-3-like n=1 Tax=Uranotaenia lowii TaxID=190385 RepID=UPI0024797416|nr:galectin-3-like [Uranotaenia lowii]
MKFLVIFSMALVAAVCAKPGAYPGAWPNARGLNGYPWNGRPNYPNSPFGRSGWNNVGPNPVGLGLGCGPHPYGPNGVHPSSYPGHLGWTPSGISRGPLPYGFNGPFNGPFNGAYNAPYGGDYNGRPFGAYNGPFNGHNALANPWGLNAGNFGFSHQSSVKHVAATPGSLHIVT